MKYLTKTILSDKTVSKVFASGIEGYLVGGYIRDIIRGERSNDMDFVVKGNIKMIVPNIFSDIDRSIVEFKDATLIRVVIGDITIDFSELKGNIEDDLCSRDFAMNAIAWSPDRGIIDPINGIEDIRKERIRAVSEKNFIDDPLRMLRAYRFAGELGWEIDRDTRKTVKNLKNLIKQSAPERITLEFFKLLNSHNYFRALKYAFLDGLLKEILSFNNNKLLDNIKALSKFNAFLKKMPEKYRAKFNEPFSQGLSYLGLLRAEQLLYNSSYSRNNLRLSRALLKRLASTEKALTGYTKLKRITKKQIFDLFEGAGDAVMDFAVLTRRKRLLDDAERFLNIKQALSTKKIIGITGARGPEIGKLIKEMRCLQFIGKINKEEDAVAWLSKL